MQPANSSSDCDWVLLRGLGRESAHWGGFILQMQKQFPKAKLHLCDLPGTGNRLHEESPTNIAAIWQSIYAKLKPQLHAQRPWKILAVSLGGMLATEAMRLKPEGLSGVVMINTSMAGVSPIHHRLRPENYSRLLKIISQRDPILKELEVLKMVSARSENYHANAQAWGQVASQRPIAIKTLFRQILAAAKFRIPLQKPTVPTLLLGSYGDCMVDPRCTLALQAYWQCTARMHQDAGHDLPLDDAAWVLSEIKTWCATENAI